MSHRLLAVDVGGVLRTRRHDGIKADEPVPETNDDRAPHEDAIEILAKLNTEGPFKGRVIIISRQNKALPYDKIYWLRHHKVLQRTGIPEHRVHFCSSRKEKDRICREHGVTHIIDNRLEVLGNISSVPHRFAFRPADLDKHLDVLPTVRVVTTWHEVRRALLID